MGTAGRNFSTATATFFLRLVVCITAAHLSQVQSFGIFELNVVSYWPGEVVVPGPCAPCPVYLRICVKHYQALVDPQSPCTFHEFRTPLLVPQNGTDLQVMQQPHTMTFDLNFTWPGEFSLIVEAWHPSERKGSHPVLVSRFIGQRSLRVGLEWTEDELSSSQGGGLKLVYRVSCAAHYYGPHCGNLCRPRDDTFGHYTCREDGQKLCKPGWTGSYCDKALCLPGCHHGTCDLPNECNCRHGWVGEFCDTCTRYPGCMHGTCNQPWQCNCDEGWGGLFCDHDLNYCTNHKPCQNGGTCTNTGQGSYTCNCTEEFMGAECDVLRNPCHSNPCRNQGTCENTSEGEFRCSCLPGFFGPHCETTASICTKNPCENGGTCLPHPQGPVCQCPTGFSGTWCEKDACANGHCLNGGTCVAVESGLRCDCSPGFSGVRCELPVPCSSDACHNGGTCLPTRPASCQCPEGFSGPRCELRVSCGPRCQQQATNSSAPSSYRATASSSKEEEEARRQVALIASLSSVLPVLLLVVCCAACCVLRRRRTAHAPSAKDCDFEVQEEQLQNERNAAAHMNNKQCNKIVNSLDRPPKVLNVDKEVLHKTLVCPPHQRTLLKKDNTAVSSHNLTPEWPSSGIYVIEDHFRSCPEVEDVLATQV